MSLRGGKSLLGMCLIAMLTGCGGVASQTKSSLFNPLSVPVDGYGGRLDISCTTNAGKWHTEKINSRWWICTPAGHAFFKQGLYITGVAPNLNVNTKYGSTANFVNAQLSRGHIGVCTGAQYRRATRAHHGQSLPSHRA